MKKLMLLLLCLMLSACLVTAPSIKMPEKLNQPSAVNMAKFNKLSVGLPQGWRLEKIPENYKKYGVLYLQHKDYGAITVYRSPPVSDVRFGIVFTKTVTAQVMPDYEKVGAPMATDTGAIIQLYKGTISVGGERFDRNMYTAYNISSGLGGKYFMHGINKDSMRYFHDFIAIANSIGK